MSNCTHIPECRCYPIEGAAQIAGLEYEAIQRAEEAEAEVERLTEYTEALAHDDSIETYHAQSERIQHLTAALRRWRNTHSCDEAKGYRCQLCEDTDALAPAEPGGTLAELAEALRGMYIELPAEPAQEEPPK